MKYTVKYKNGLRWHTVKNVKADGLVENGLSRFIILEDETRIEIPCQNTLFKFSKERYLVIKQNMGDQAGQDVRTKR